MQIALVGQFCMTFQEPSRIPSRTVVEVSKDLTLQLKRWGPRLNLLLFFPGTKI